MRSPALALAWELWGRNRAGISAVLAGVLAFALAGVAFSVSLHPNRPHLEGVFIWSVIHFAVAFLYLISITLYGEIRKGEFLSGFPARLFTLPVRTSVLVGLPMLYGAVALVLLWSAMTLLVWLPAEADMQWWVLPLLVVSLVWFQTVCWVVPGPPLAKIIAACVLFPILKFALEMLSLAVAIYLYRHPQLDRNAFIESRVLTLTIFCGVLVPLAYGVAVWGVGRHRRGAYASTAWIGRLFEFVSSLWPKRRASFASAPSAQLWVEWRKKGLILPLFPACFLLFVAIVVAPFVGMEAMLVLFLVVAGTVVGLAFFVGYGLGKTSFWGGNLDLSSFQATRPLSSSDLAAAKIHAAAWSAFATWTLLLIVMPLWLWLRGDLTLIAGIFERLRDVVPLDDDAVAQVLLPHVQQFTATQGIALLGFGFVGLCGLTWGQMVGGMCASVTGRVWVVNIVVVVYMAVIGAFIWACCIVALNPSQFDVVVTLFTWCAVAIGFVKLIAAGGAILVMQRCRLLEWRRLAILLTMWSVAAGALAVFVFLLLPVQGVPLRGATASDVNLIPTGLVALTAILALPLVRMIAAPLALAWNRVR